MAAHDDSLCAADLSAHVIRRFRFKCLVFLVWSSAVGLAGFGFSRQLASLFLMSGILAQLLGIWRGERTLSPHWTSFDEATWFILAGSLLLRLDLP